MLLPIQIAIGIVLAYAIIVNHKKLLALGGWLLAGVAAIAAVGALVWAGAAAIQLASEWIPPNFWGEMWTLMSVVPVFILAATGTLGMMMLAGLLLGRSPTKTRAAVAKLADGQPGKTNDNSGCLAVIGLMVLMVLINFGLSFPVWSYTPVGRWYETIDSYGRAHGWQDGLSDLFGAVLWQWVWGPLGLYFLVKRLVRGQDKSEVTEPSEPTSASEE